MSIVVAVDCDEVLCEFISGINKWHNRVHGTNTSLSQYTSTHFASVPGWGGDAVTNQKVRDFFSGSPEWLGLSPLIDAFSTLEALKMKFPFFEFHVVTARSCTQREDTLKWLSRHFPGIFKNAHFLSAYDNPLHQDAPVRTKGEVCKELGACMLVDDSAKYCIEAAVHVPLVILFSRMPWNTGDPSWEHPGLPCNIVSTKTWAVLGKVLNRVGSIVELAGGRGPVTPLKAPIPFSSCRLICLSEEGRVMEMGIWELFLQCFAVHSPLPDGPLSSLSFILESCLELCEGAVVVKGARRILEKFLSVPATISEIPGSDLVLAEIKN